VKAPVTTQPQSAAAAKRRAKRARFTADGSVLVIVLWVALGLVSVALYFAHSMAMELRATDNRVASLEAAEAIAGAVRYLTNLLANVEQPGLPPDFTRYPAEAVKVGEATFWLIGRDTNVWQNGPTRVVFGLVDEASKLNLNTATLEMLEALPWMPPELAAATMDWRDTDEEVTPNGAENETYARLNPPRLCKNAPFESIEELRLVAGAYLDVLYGEDANLNGVLDLNENDGDITLPSDNRDGRLDPGILEYVTIHSREPNTRSDGSTRVSVGGQNQQQLTSLLQEKFGAERANGVVAQLRGATPGSVLEFYLRSGLTAEEFAQIESEITVTNAAVIPGLVNVNTASAAVLACIPGIGVENANSLVARRQASSSQLASLAWVAEVLEATNAIRAGPFLTSRSYQFSADVAAVGHHGRGYQRVKFILDTSEATPRVVYRRDLTHLGWALGREVRNQQELLARNMR
jgi:type II secretory pathway component PulK